MQLGAHDVLNWRDVQASCDAGEDAVSGSCYAVSSTHKLVSTYAIEAPLDVVDDEQSFYDGIGWNCEWDTAATATNTHSVAVLCCPSYPAADCVF